MKRKITFAAISFFISLNAISQPAIQWQKSLGGTGEDYARSIQQTADGGYIEVGWSESNNGDVTGNHGFYDYWLIKTDAGGNIQWQKCLGGTDNDYAFSVQQTADGGFIVNGISNSNDGDVTGNHGNYDSWLVKTEGSGNIQWQKSLGGTADDGGFSIQQTADGGFIMAGTSYSNDGDVTGHHGSGIFSDSWLVKTDGSGNIQWQKSLGGMYDEEAYSVQQTVDGGFIVAGYAASNDGDVTGNHGIYDYWMVKTDGSGNIQWQKCLGGTGLDKALSVQQAADGGYIMAGYIFSNDGDVTGNHGNVDYWLVKTDGSGNIQWQKCLGGTAEDEAYSVQQTTDGGYMVAGWTFSNDGNVTGNHGGGDYWLIKTDGSGNIQWQKCFGGTLNEQGCSVQQTTDAGYIVAGVANSNDGDVTGHHGNSAYPDCWLVKLAPIVSIEENSFHTDSNIFPNPFTTATILTIHSQFSFREAQLKIYDVTGREVKQIEIRNRKSEIKRENLLSGIYIFKVQNENEIIGTGKLIIQ